MFTVGKYVGEVLVNATDRVVVKALRDGGKNGNKYAQTACDAMGIEYQQVDENAVVGFKVD